jgi:hypothetical protein
MFSFIGRGICEFLRTQQEEGDGAGLLMGTA